jgi:hypothetical protein
MWKPGAVVAPGMGLETAAGRAEVFFGWAASAGRRVAIAATQHPTTQMYLFIAVPSLSLAISIHCFRFTHFLTIDAPLVVVLSKGLVLLDLDRSPVGSVRASVLAALSGRTPVINGGPRGPAYHQRFRGHFCRLSADFEFEGLHGEILLVSASNTFMSLLKRSRVV